MNSEFQASIRSLEDAWSKPDGFLGKVRDGVFDQQKAADFLSTLENIKLPTGDVIDRRLVALLWYIPTFLSWQTKRVADKGGDAVAFERLISRVQGILENILGYP